MKSIESFSYKYIVLSLIFGVLLYDYIGRYWHFTYVDELLLVALLVVTYLHARLNKETKYVIGIFFFYLLYSLIFGVACKEAIFMDAIIYLKPLVGFYGSYALGLRLNKRHKAKVRKLIIVIAVVMMALSLLSYDYIMMDFMGNPARFATLFQIMGMLYLFCSNKTKKDFIIAIALWGCALLSLRSKSYAFFAAMIFIFYFMDAKRFQKLKMSTVLIIGIGACLMFVVVWEKFQFYFVTGMGDDISDSFARPALYMGAGYIFQDYFPLGTGFGSYASFASSVYYSPLYAQYRMDNLWGLREDDDSNFISDTFFPQLAQFGIVGLILFISFFRKRYKQTILLYKQNRNKAIMKMSILIIVFFLIESTTDSTFVHNRGMVMMVLWAIILKESENQKRI